MKLAVEATPVAIVNEVVPAFPPAGVTVAGAKLHVESAGSPEQLKLIAEANPNAGVAVTVVVALLPLATDAEVGLSDKEKVGEPTITLTADEADAAKMASPL